MSELGFDTLKAVQAFKSGTSPLEAVEYLNVGREVWHEGTIWYLDNFVDGGRSAVRFVQGVYGEGKTHFLYLTAKAALDRDYVVSYVTAESARLDKFDTVYTHLVQSLRNRHMVKEEGLDFSSATNGLKRILDDWFRAEMSVAESKVSDRYTQKPKILQAFGERVKGLDEDKKWDPNFRSAIEAYFMNLQAGTDEANEQNALILNWLQGVALPKAETRAFGVYEPIKPDNSREMVRSLVLMLRALGYSGLVALFDELERILEQAPKARNKAYQTIRQLLDNADRAGTQWCYVLCAITGELLTSQKGFREYDALWERVKSDVGPMKDRIDKRAIIVNLELTPFEDDQLVSLAQKVRAIHADAFGWGAAERVDDDVIKVYVDQLVQSKYGLSISVPRVLVRSMIQILEKSEQYPDYSALTDVAGEIGDALSALEDDRKTKIWE
jgi:KaiC/GvpD/RAD55 family RecA-like ATPase